MEGGSRGNTKPNKPAKPGSVRAARERLEAGKQDGPQPPVASQWPLSSQGGGGNEAAPPAAVPSQSNFNRGPPPQRPPRPSYVPSILDSTRVKEHMAAGTTFDDVQDQNAVTQQARYWEPNYLLSPQAPSTPGTGISSSSSRDSTGSSVGSIPEFPVPALPQNPPAPLQFRKNTNLGPPPSSRRGASSYYSQSSYVAPIPEEAWEPSSPARRAYPGKPKWPREFTNDDSEDYYGARPEEDDMDDRDSRSTDPDDMTGLVRKASLGKQYKPSLTTVRSFKDMKQPNIVANEIEPGHFAAEGMPVILDDLATPTFLRGPSEESQDQNDGFVEQKKSASTSRSRSPTVDPEVELIMGGLQKGGALKSGTLPPTIMAYDGSSSPPRRPPPLDIDRVKQGEARGSLTSLSDLIRRATKVASNLERGRTASRLGMLDMFNSSNPNLLKQKEARENQRRNSIGDMLNNFPAPAISTPTRPESRSRWPSPFVNSQVDLAQSPGLYEKQPEQRRRCCGMPVWLFVLLLIILFLLIAAAVVIPVVLIVLPRQNQSSTSSNPLANCASTNPCSNGGVSVVFSNSCSCVCSNGFTGANCTVSPSANSGCTSSNVDSFKNATTGSSIPRLISGAQSNFSVPINSTALLSSFASQNLACTDENKLVTFSSSSSRRDLDAPHPLVQYLSPAVTLAPRLAAPVPDGPASPITSNGIVFAGGPSTAPNLATTGTASAPSSAPTSTSITPTTRQLDFAGVAILYILQTTNQLQIAQNAQQSLQKAFTGGNFQGPVIASGPGRNGSNVTVAVDLELITVRIGSMIVGKTSG